MNEKLNKKSDWHGRYVRTRSELRTNGGTIFPPGTVMQVSLNRGGLSLRLPQKCICNVTAQHSAISKVGEREVDLLPIDYVYEPVKPIDMILHCPMCARQHVDEADPMTCQTCGNQGDNECICEVPNYWLNPPHKSHLCHGCGCVWRPADVPTNGVEKISTRGEKDTWPS